MNTHTSRLQKLHEEQRMEAHARRRRKYEQADRDYQNDLELLAAQAKEVAGLMLAALSGNSTRAQAQ